jgi:hypothetical protein
MGGRVWSGISILDTILFEACVAEEAHLLMSNFRNRNNELKQQITINDEKINTYQKNILKSESKKDRNNSMYLNGNISEEKYKDNTKLIDSEIKDYTNSIVLSKKLNRQLQKRIDVESSDKEAISNSYKKNENDVYAVDDLLEKQQIVQRHIREVNIIDEIPNHTRIVNIYFHAYSHVPLQYRVHFNKKPQMIEICEDFYDEEHSSYYFDGYYDAWDNRLWVDVPFKIEKRFVRKKTNS